MLVSLDNLCYASIVSLSTTIGTTRGLVPTVGVLSCKEQRIGSTPISSSKTFTAGYNQTADGEPHKLADVRSTRTPAPINPVGRFGFAEATRPDQFSR